MSNVSADLHLHTIFSDGTDSPAEVVERIHKAGIKVMAIADHDNVEAMAIARPLAEAKGIKYLNGIEMSASFEGIEVHILGYLFNPEHAGLKQHLTIQQARRVERVYETAKRLATVGVSISPQEVLDLAGPGTVGRPHVARVLLKHGHVSSVAEAFQRFIGNDGPAFVSGSEIKPAVIIRLIRDAGGVPVIAHPIYLKRDELLDRFAAEGLEGIEVYHSSHSNEQAKRYESIADRLKLIRTGGSDYHGESNKEGVVIGACRLDGRFVDALLARHAALAGK